MTKNIWKPLRLVMIAGATSTVLVACGKGGGGNDVFMPPPPPPPPAPANFEDQFGAGFAAAFGKMTIDDPNPVAVGDVIDLDKTADSVDVPDPS